MLSAVTAVTDTVGSLAALRLMVNVALTVPALPSVTLTSLIESVGRVVVGDGADALGVGDGGIAAPDRLTKKVSLISSSMSPWTGTVNVCVVSPGRRSRPSLATAV